MVLFLLRVFSLWCQFRILVFGVSFPRTFKSNPAWHLSPAYDLTYSSSFNGEHATTINGEGKNPSLNDILAVAKNIGIKEKHVLDIALDIKDKCLSLFD